MLGRARTTRALRAENRRLRQRILQLQQQLQAQTMENQELATLADHLLDGVVFLDPTWKIIYTNAAFCQLMGYAAPQQLIGLDVGQLLVELPGQMNQVGATLLH